MNASAQRNGAKSCLHAERLREACCGLADDRQIAEIEDHLAVCAPCRQLLAELDEAAELSDAVVQALSTMPGNTDDEQEFRELESTLLTMSPAGRQAGDRRLADPPIGTLPQTLGNYELLACVGRGAWGAIYRARHLKLDQIVAVKVLDATRLHLAPAVEHFVQEMKAVGQLTHPNIVRATDAGEDRGFHYLVMEYLEGVDAARLLRRETKLPSADACEIVRQAAIALDFAHQRRWIHRDVKPSNLMITADGEVKLLDLGIAGRREVDAAAHIEQTPLGTADYMAPEQWKSFATVDARADVYSLGCTLYKLLTGRSAQSSEPPKGAASEATPVASLARLRSETGRGLERIIRRMLAVRPEGRYQTAAQVADALKPWARRADLPAVVARFGVAHGHPLRQPSISAANSEADSRTSTRRRLLTGVAALAGVGFLAPWILRRRAPQLRRSKWRALQVKSPGLLLTTDALDRIEVDVDDPAQIGIRSDKPTLVSLGRAVAGPLALRVALEQEAPQSSSGLFFRWRRLDRPQPSAEFHTIELASHIDADGLRRGRFVWTRCIARRESRELVVATETLGESTDVFTLSIPQQQLVVTLGRSSVPEVQCNQETLPAGGWTLSTDGRRYANLESGRLADECLGGLGLINTCGVSLFRSPELAYL